MKLIRRLTICGMALLLLISGSASAGSVRALIRDLAEISDPYSMVLSARTEAFVPFTGDRLDQVNALLQHLSLRLQEKDDFMEASVRVDETEAFRMTARESKGLYRTVFSFAPEKEWVSSDPFEMIAGMTEKSGETPAIFPYALSGDLFRLPDDGYDLIASLPALYPEETRFSKIRTKFRDLGTAVQKCVITIPRAGTEAGMMSRLAEKCANPTAKRFLSTLVFTGRQQFILYFDEEEKVLKALYSGTAGRNKDDLRKISLEWQGFRKNGGSQDQVVLRAPAVSGGNRDVMTVTLLETDSAEEAQTLSGQLSFTRVRDRVKTVWEAQADLQLAERLTGSVVLERKSGDAAFTLTLNPDLQKNGEKETEGSLHVHWIENKAELADLTFRLTLSGDSEILWQEPLEVIQWDEQNEQEKQRLAEEWARQAASALLLSLLQAPDSDLGFFNHELDTTVWKTFTESIRTGEEKKK